MLKVLFFCGILTVSMSVDLKSEGAAMDITTKKGRRGRKDIFMAFFNSAVDVLQTLVVALGAGLGIWGVINLMEGYGNDNRATRS